MTATDSTGRRLPKRVLRQPPASPDGAINLTDPDELAEGLDLTPLVASRHEIRTALSNSFGFGGQNTALIFTRYSG